MESISEANWSSFNATVSVEESEIMAQLLGSYSFANESDQNSSSVIPSMFWSDFDVFPSYSGDNINSSLYYLPLENTGNTCSSFFIPPSDHESYCLSDPNVVPTIITSSTLTDFCLEQNANSSIQIAPTDHLLEVPAYLIKETSSEEMGDSGTKPSDLDTPSDRSSSPKRKFQMPELGNPSINGIENKEPQCPRKKARASIEVQKNGKNAVSKKAPKSFIAEGSNAALTGQTSSSYSSEDDSNASQELNGGGESSSMKVSAALNLNGKTRAGRGSATDPQSLYARKRRERINERLKVLQNLVPNGTKVDISTMLEEAVQYVKFLQLQIKLLSSDDLWMYAPIAYNGMDLGLDLKISPPQ